MYLVCAYCSIRVSDCSVIVCILILVYFYANYAVKLHHNSGIILNFCPLLFSVLFSHNFLLPIAIYVCDCKINSTVLCVHVCAATCLVCNYNFDYALAIDSVTNEHLDNVAKIMFPRWQDTKHYSYDLYYVLNNADKMPLLRCVVCLRMYSM